MNKFIMILAVFCVALNAEALRRSMRRKRTRQVDLARRS